MTLLQIITIEFNVRKIHIRTYEPELQYNSGYRVQAITHSGRREEGAKVFDEADLVYSDTINQGTNLSAYVFPELKDAASKIVEYLVTPHNGKECREYAVISAPVDAHLSTPIIHRAYIENHTIKKERAEVAISQHECESLMHQIKELYTQAMQQKTVSVKAE